MGARGLLAGLIAILAVAVSIGSAVVRSEAEEPAHLSQKIWPKHPTTLRSEAMAQIGLAAAQGRLPSSETMGRVRLLATRAPLEPEPFLVEAALAQKRNEATRAARLLIEARRRDPRSPGARYLLAEQLIRNGDIVGGLQEMTVLSRMVPGWADQLMPGLVAYARTPGAIPKLRQLFRESPDLLPVLLSSLASDAANVDLVLALAPTTTPSNDPQPWRAKLLRSIVDAGMYARAYDIWSRFSGVRGPPSPGLFRPDFVPTPEPPPFNWTFAQSGGGLAEPSSEGGLRVFHYGRRKTVLASQLMLLPAGRYSLSFAISGDLGSDGQLRWRISCLPSGPPLLDLPLTRSSAARAEGQFQVPSGCTAQQIELVGAPTDTPRSSDATISQLRLSRVAT